MFTPIAPLAQSFTIEFNGKPMAARPGETIAACLLRAKVPSFRTTPVGGAPRLPFCMIGHCFDCLVQIDGFGSKQACLCLVQAGMRIWPQEVGAPIPVIG